MLGGLRVKGDFVEHVIRCHTYFSAEKNMTGVVKMITFVITSNKTLWCDDLNETILRNGHIVFGE